MPRKLAKTVRISVEIDHIKNGKSSFGQKELDWYFPHCGAAISSVKVSQLNSWPLHSMGNTSSILSSQNVTLVFDVVYLHKYLYFS